ncbi:hypothetical protein ACXZ1K_14840 [Pedobacter sp. PWIIR3]
MIKDDLVKLISTLSISEKMAFKKQLMTRRVGKQYGKLFEMIETFSTLSFSELKKKLISSFPGSSLDNAAAYLTKLLTDMLVLQRIDQDPGYARYFSLLKANLYTERSMHYSAKKELKNLQKQALEQQDFMIYFQAIRTELNQHNFKAYPEMNEQKLVEKQFQAQSSLRNLSLLNEHFSLYELLSHRLAMQGQTDATKLKVFNFDDLALTELGIVTRGTQHLFNSRKLHLLFQAYFFMEKGKFSSALQTFRELHELMEGNALRWDFPPYDYLSTLTGILDAFAKASQYDEMNYFIDKLAVLSKSSYPDHFIKLCSQTNLFYSLEISISRLQFEQALAELKGFEPDIYKSKFSLGNIAHLKVLFYGGLSAFRMNRYKQSLKYIAFAVSRYNKSSDTQTYRLCRLLYIMIHAELGNFDLLKYDMRSFKKVVYKDDDLNGVEEYIYMVSMFDFKKASRAQIRRLWDKLQIGDFKLVDTNQFFILLDIRRWLQDKFKI